MRSGSTGRAGWIVGAVLAATLVATPVRAAAPRGTSVLRSVGVMTATTERPAEGVFELVEKIKIDGRERPQVEILAEGLDARRDESGRRPPHGAFLMPPGGGEIFLGEVRVNGKGDGFFRRRNLSKLLGTKATTLRELVGGDVEIRSPMGTVLRGAIPAFALDGAGSSSDRRETYGLFSPVSSAAPNSAPGRFTFRTDEHAPGDVRNRAVITASGLPPTSTYTVYLFGPRTVNLGNMENHPNRGATLSLDSRRAAIPGSISRWSEFDGGTIEVRRGGTIMLRGAITIFRAASERVEDAGWARSRAKVELAPTAVGGDARGLLTAAVMTSPRRRRQEIRVQAFDLPQAGNPYTVITVEPDGVTHIVGSFDVRGSGGAGGFRLSTRHGDRTPPGGVLGQAGRPVEVVDAVGTTVLTATFPSLD